MPRKRPQVARTPAPHQQQLPLRRSPRHEGYAALRQQTTAALNAVTPDGKRAGGRGRVPASPQHSTARGAASKADQRFAGTEAKTPRRSTRGSRVPVPATPTPRCSAQKRRAALTTPPGSERAAGKADAQWSAEGRRGGRGRASRPDEPDSEEAARRARCKRRLDAQLDIAVGPLLGKLERFATSRHGDATDGKTLSLAEAVSQVSGLAGVRRFVDEQLVSDLKARAHACHDVLKANTTSGGSLPKRGPGAGPPVAAPVAPAASLRQQARPRGSKAGTMTTASAASAAATAQAALAPFRSSSRSAVRRR
eukprot:TRINITY_DN13367_c0_g1_i1.p1 TRINITY_DN13367_c0_g1~~TRINITY_DN13367_c0_g1_i1.p1  ORF type:complete len:337 (+),score=65.38 TRINITY_DN13367_c0_g1_i1:86-1012(+)